MSQPPSDDGGSQEAWRQLKELKRGLEARIVVFVFVSLFRTPDPMRAALLFSALEWWVHALVLPFRPPARAGHRRP